VTTIPEHDVDETINGKETRVTTVKVALEPGETGRPHRHAGPVFGYVLEGEFQLGLGEDLNSEASTLPIARPMRSTRRAPWLLAIGRLHSSRVDPREPELAGLR